MTSRRGPRTPDPRERRTVTVLFSDLSGFTRLAGGLDPEEVGDLIDALFRRLRGAVERKGGATVNRPSEFQIAC